MTVWRWGVVQHSSGEDRRLMAELKWTAQLWTGVVDGYTRWGQGHQGILGPWEAHKNWTVPHVVFSEVHRLWIKSSTFLQIKSHGENTPITLVGSLVVWDHNGNKTMVWSLPPLQHSGVFCPLLLSSFLPGSSFRYWAKPEESTGLWKRMTKRHDL